MISKRPGRKPAFTRRQAIDAALAEGIETFTLRAVADRLGVKATALYREFSSRQELQLAAIAEIAVDIEPDPDVSNWQDALRQVVDRQWALCERYPEAPLVLMAQPEAFGGSDASYRGDRAETGRAWCPRRGRGGCFRLRLCRGHHLGDLCVDPALSDR